MSAVIISYRKISLRKRTKVFQQLWIYQNHKTKKNTMILKDDELVIIGLINENKIEGNVQLKEVKSVFYDLI